MKKHWIERLTEFADKNPFCFIVGIIISFDFIRLIFNFILALFGKGSSCKDDED